MFEASPGGGTRIGATASLVITCAVYLGLGSGLGVMKLTFFSLSRGAGGGRGGSKGLRGIFAHLESANGCTKPAKYFVAS